MQRDMNLIRDILLAVEASDEDPRGMIDLDIPGRSKKEVAYHVQLLGEAGLLDVRKLSTMGTDGFDCRPKSLTWPGHDFLDAIRDDGIWSGVLDKLKAVGGATTLEVVKTIAISIAKEKLGIGN